MTTKHSRTPGRPRQFDPEQAVETAQHLFHSRGYDAVSVADLTKAFGINPPSFYAAFGSKLGLYTRVLKRYRMTDAIPLGALLRHDRPTAKCLIDVLMEAARRYVADPDATGCLVLEGAHCNDKPAREAACEFYIAAENLIRTYVAMRYPQEADRDANFIEKNEQGVTVNRWLSTGMLCASAASNETGMLTQKFARSLGMLAVDNQARV